MSSNNKQKNSKDSKAKKPVDIFIAMNETNTLIIAKKKKFVFSW